MYTEQHKTLVGKLESLIGEVAFSSEQNLRLERISALLENLGNPQEQYRTIHVGGTSGKGSTSAYISNILQSAGYKVGLFLSPYLQIVNEMYVIDGMCARTSELLEIFADVERAFPVVERIGFGIPSYFETMFAIAAVLFARHHVDVAVVEVGLGGKLDATNVIESAVSVLVSVGLDHTEILGETVEEIASEKVGIIKQNSYVVCGFLQETTKSIAKTRAIQASAELFEIDEHFGYRSSPAGLFLSTPSLGDFQIPKLDHSSYAHNIACAAMAYELFSRVCQKPPKISAIVEGTQRGFLTGRLEEVQRNPTVIVDGAHNADKIGSLFDSIKARCSTPILIVATKRGRELDEEFFRLIRESSAKKIIATTFRSRGIWTAMPALQLAARLARTEDDSRVVCIDHAEDALEYALRISDAHDVICATGSFFLVGDIRERWHPSGELLLSIENAWATPALSAGDQAHGSCNR